MVAEDRKLNVLAIKLYTEIATPAPARSDAAQKRPIIAVSTRDAMGSIVSPASAGRAMAAICLSIFLRVTRSVASPSLSPPDDERTIVRPGISGRRRCVGITKLCVISAEAASATCSNIIFYLHGCSDNFHSPHTQQVSKYCTVAVTGIVTMTVLLLCTCPSARFPRGKVRRGARGGAVAMRTRAPVRVLSITTAFSQVIRTRRIFSTYSRLTCHIVV